jgi:hypothetical protein
MHVVKPLLTWKSSTPTTTATFLIQSYLNVPGMTLHAYSTLTKFPLMSHQLSVQSQGLLVIGLVMPPRIVNSSLLSLSRRLVLYLIAQLLRHNILIVNQA